MSQDHKYLLLTLIFILFIPSLIFSKDKKKTEPLILKHADELETNLDQETQVTSLNGKVWFQQGDFDLKIEKGIWY